MKASDIMTKEIVSITPDTSVKEIAGLMTSQRVSGMPVVDGNGKLVGIVSESDLLHRAETGTERKRKWWLGVFQDSDRLAREFVKSHGLKASDIMTSRVTTIDSNADLGEVADQLDRHKLKRLPVVEGGRIVGMITRADLVRALAQATVQPAAGIVDDLALEKAIRLHMRKAEWLDSIYINVRVANGVAELSGLVASADQRKALRVLVAETPGVTSVEDRTRLRPTNVSS